MVCDTTAFIQTSALGSPAQRSRKRICRGPSSSAPFTSPFFDESQPGLRAQPFTICASGSMTAGADFHLRSSMMA